MPFKNRFNIHDEMGEFQDTCEALTEIAPETSFHVKLQGDMIIIDSIHAKTMQERGDLINYFGEKNIEYDEDDNLPRVIGTRFTISMFTKDREYRPKCHVVTVCEESDPELYALLKTKGKV